MRLYMHFAKTVVVLAITTITMFTLFVIIVMKNIIFFTLLLSAQFGFAQIESQSITEFKTFDSSKEILIDVRIPGMEAGPYIKK